MKTTLKHRDANVLVEEFPTGKNKLMKKLFLFLNKFMKFLTGTFMLPSLTLAIKKSDQ